MFVSVLILIIATCKISADIGDQKKKNDVIININDATKQIYHDANFNSSAFNYGEIVKPVGAKRNDGQFDHKVKGPDAATYGCYGWYDPVGTQHIFFYIADDHGMRYVKPNQPIKIYDRGTDNTLTMKTKDWNDLYFPIECGKEYNATAESTQASSASLQSSNDQSVSEPIQQDNSVSASTVVTQNLQSASEVDGKNNALVSRNESGIFNSSNDVIPQTTETPSSTVYEIVQGQNDQSVFGSILQDNSPSTGSIIAQNIQNPSAADGENSAIVWISSSTDVTLIPHTTESQSNTGYGNVPAPNCDHHGHKHPLFPYRYGFVLEPVVFAKNDNLNLSQDKKNQPPDYPDGPHKPDEKNDHSNCNNHQKPIFLPYYPPYSFEARESDGKNSDPNSSQDQQSKHYQVPVVIPYYPPYYPKFRESNGKNGPDQENHHHQDQDHNNCDDNNSQN